MGFKESETLELKRSTSEIKEPDADFMEVGTHFVTVFRRKVGEKLGERLGENEKRIMSLIGENPDITIPEIAESLKISTTAVENKREGTGRSSFEIGRALD